MKKNLNRVILGSVLLVTMASTAYFQHANKNLKADLLKSQTESKGKIESLEAEVENLTKEKNQILSASNNLSSAKKTPSPAKAANSPTPETVAETGTAAETETLNGPHLVSTPETVDLGTISKNDGIATAIFELKNTGTSDLTINYALTSCGCTVTPIKEEKVLKPGEIFPMEVTYDPNFYGAQYELGAIEKTITIISNDSNRSFYKVKLKANVNP